MTPKSAPESKDTPRANASTNGSMPISCSRGNVSGPFATRIRNAAYARPETQRSAEHSQRHAFDEHFPRDSPPAGAERGSDREFLPAGLGADEQQIGHVRAGDQEHQPQRPHHHPQRRADVADDFLLQRLEPGREASVLKHRAIDSRRRRPGMQPDPQHASHIGVGLLHRDAGLEPRNALVGEGSQKLLCCVRTARKNQLGIALKRNSSGITPITVCGLELIVSVRPTMDRSPPNGAASSRR